MSEEQNLIEPMTFEQAYVELEETVQKLEAGSLPLAEAIALYQRGMALARHCGQHLDEAELNIKLLSPTGDLIDFEEDNELH
jgi:exodeoxyribonuclease VII small subunit